MCSKCNDTEMIYNQETNTCTICECRQMKHYNKILENSGMNKGLRSIGFKEFDTENKNEIIKIAKQTCIEFTKNFKQIEQDKNNFIALLGQAGAGKTHLTMSIANNLMASNIPVRYFRFRDEIGDLKRCINDEINFTKLINPLRSVRVLLIDDLFKFSTRNGNINESELSIMHEILDYRYFNQKPTIISSELISEQLLDIDMAFGSRIIERCDKRIIEFKGIELNYRLN